MTCNRCAATGFLNTHQVPPELRGAGIEAIQKWVLENVSDVQVCDCCGDGEEWHGEPGQHFEGGDHSGRYGPYAYNGGLPECY